MVSRRAFLGSLAALASAERDASDIASLIRAHKLSAVLLTRQCLARIDTLNSKLNAFIAVTRPAALRDAEELDRDARAGKWRGPLHGVPIALKDLYDTAGVRTTAASNQWRDRVPTEDAEVVRRLKAAGAIILGKLNMDEFAYNYTGETSAFATSRNPWNVERSPGGSSGGSAVAVATEMCFGALGSDTGGSIRLPAALCGITGFKPTYGAISTKGVAPLAWSLDHVGPMCRSARDAMLMTEVLMSRPVRDVGARVRSLRLGVPRALFYEGLEPEVATVVATATEVLGKLTAGTRDVVLPALRPFAGMPDLPEHYSQVIVAEAYAFHEKMLRDNPDLYHPGTRKSIETGASVTAPQYIRARLEMDRLRAESESFFNDADLLITPTAPGAAFEFGKGRLVFLRNTAPWNLLGLPTVSIPCGFTSHRLPVGLQITGRAGQDDIVLSLAAAYQKLTDWHKQRPPV